jgi:uncharacterized protein YfdQ (DUF2303 family)
MAKYSDAQIANVLLGRFAFRVVPFPGSPETLVAVRLLTESDVDKCRVMALADLQTIAKQRGVDLAAVTNSDPELQQRLIERHIVWLAFYDHETIEQKSPGRFFELPSEVASLDSTTASKLLELYIEHQILTTPFTTATTEEAVKEIVEALGKGQSAAASLVQYERNTLARLVHILASKLRETLPTNKSSTG